MCVDTHKAVFLLRVNVNDTSVFHDEFVHTLNHWKKCSEKYLHIAANSKSGNRSIVTRKKGCRYFGVLKTKCCQKMSWILPEHVVISACPCHVAALCLS